MTPLSQHTTTRIREAAILPTVVSRYVRLKPSGAGRMQGLCPFHEERTPSFSVSTVKNLWTCFGCGAGGDVFTFLQRIEGISFIEARKQLADQFGIPLEDRPMTRAERADARRQAAYITEVSNEAAVWWRWVRWRYQQRFETVMALAVGCSDRGWEDWYQVYARRAWRWGKLLRRLDAMGPQAMFRRYQRVRSNRVAREVVAAARAEERLWSEIASGINPQNWPGFISILGQYGDSLWTRNSTN